MDYLLLIFFVIILLFSITGGAMRGFKREIGRIIFIVVSGVLSLLLSKPVSAFIISRIRVENSIDLEVGTLADLAAVSSTLNELCENVPLFIIAPIIFFLLYIVLCFINLIIGSIVMSKIPKENKMKGMLLGLVAAVVSFTIFCAPMAAVLLCGTDMAQSIPEDYVTALEEKYITDSVAELAQQYGAEDVEGSLNKIGICRFCSPLGKSMLSYMSGKRINGTHLSLFDELYSMRFILGKSLPFIYELEDAEKASLADVIPDIADYLANSKLLKKVLPEIVDGAFNKWQAGESFAGIEADTDDPVKSILVSYVINNHDNINEAAIESLLEAISKTAKALEELADENGDVDIESIGSSEALKELLAEASDDEQLQQMVDGLIGTAVGSIAARYDGMSFYYYVVAADFIDEVNNADGEQAKNLIKHGLEAVGYTISDEVAEYLEGYLERNLGGTDWDAAILKQELQKFY